MWKEVTPRRKGDPFSPNKTIHNEIGELWVKSGGQAREMAFTNCWLLLELMVSGIAFKAKALPGQKARFSERLIKNLDSLSAAIAVEVGEKAATSISPYRLWIVFSPAEAAQCMLHAAALASEYIAMTMTDGNMPPRAAVFSKVSGNVYEESNVRDDVVSPETDGIYESRHFTAGGLNQLVEKTASLLDKAQRLKCECVAPGEDPLQVIELVLSEWIDYRSLAAIHSRISEALSKIEPPFSIAEDIANTWLSPLRNADKRGFGSYFRVGFYGTRFADLEGEEFIYKEPPFTKLSEISHRLESFYMERFGKGVVEVIKDSNNVTRNGHMTDKAYLQITYVESYWDKWERRRRQTHFERSHSVKRFSYATPFTKDGKAHGDLKDQYKRRTVLTTQKSFPYVKTRIRVVEKEQKVFQPIQVAIEKKTRELSAVIAQVPADAKMLQMVLQGCIGTTGNQGPAEIANVFLTDVLLDEKGKPVDKLQNKLRLSFHDFSKRCADALALNKQLIQHDQLAYQNELQKNYVDFTAHGSDHGRQTSPSSLVLCR